MVLVVTFPFKILIKFLYPSYFLRIGRQFHRVLNYPYISFTDISSKVSFNFIVSSYTLVNSFHLLYLTKSTNCMTLLNFPRIYKINCPHFISHIKRRCTSTSTWLSGFTYLFVFNKKVQHFLCIPLYFKLNCLTFIKMVAEKYDYRK